MAFRFFALTIFFILGYSLLGFNLYKLQIEEGNYYFKKAEARNEFQRELELRRGRIFFNDRSGNRVIAALNRDYPVIFASPKEIKDPAFTARLLAPIIDWEEDALYKALNNPHSLFRLLVEKASKEKIKAVSELQLEGIYLGEKQYRFYPYQRLAAHLLGFVGVNENYETPVGLYGVEKFYEPVLNKGNSLNLTVDINIQAESEQLLQELIKEFKAKSGTVIVEEPKTGKILALANVPDFDPNIYSEFPVKNFLNPATSGIYEPGSVLKPITMAAGIDLGVITPETTYIDKGSVTLNGKTILNWDKRVYGEITMTQVLERSVNTGAVFVESQIGHKNFLAYLKKFGFGEASGIDLPEEATGSLRSLERKDARDIDFATASFGQGPALTPLQLVNAYSAIANGGLLMRPYLQVSQEPKVIRRVISEKTAHKVGAMMEQAVEKAGVAVLTGYRVAGKTGTAQVPDFTKGGYTEELIHTYVGFAPVSDPRFVILIKLDKPASPLARFTVVPAFRRLAEYILNYYHIAPDKVE